MARAALGNEAVAALLDEYASLRENAGDKPYRVGAYRRAAVAVALWPHPVLEWIRAGNDPQEIRGVGPSIGAALAEIARTGTFPALEDTRRRYTLVAPARRSETASRSAQGSRRRRPRAPTSDEELAVRGDLHAHTNATDGRDGILAMAQAAQALGYEYLAITDHSQETRVAGGLDEVRMRLHLDRVRRASEALDGITLLAGAEVDILRDGRLDFPDRLLADMDLAVCSVHFRHRLTPKEQMERILRGMSNDHASILAHPTGRRSGIRPGLELDLDALARAAADQGWAIEMNGSPERLDLDAAMARTAAELGARFALDSDAHSTRELANVANCRREARRAGLKRDQVLNCQSLAKLRRALRH